MREILLYFSCLHEGDWNSIYKSIIRLEKHDEEKLKEYKKQITSNYITILDDDYPDCFKSIMHPPYVLFYKGNFNLINSNNIGVIGSRENTEYGSNITKELVIDLVNKGYTIVSGMAKGIDSIAHETCLDRNGFTIAVVGSGLNYTYPKSNESLQNKIINKGLIISEYPDFVKPKSYHYPNRNRLIAGLSKSIIVTEAKKKSGTLITVRYGLEYGKDIYAVPYPVNSNSGCNDLIKEGANLIEKVEDISD